MVIRPPFQSRNPPVLKARGLPLEARKVVPLGADR
jgi:hypothetical protein